MKRIIRIPRERLEILKTEKTTNLKKIEKITETELKIEDNLVVIEGKSFKVWKAKDFIKAIGRGFTLSEAKKVLEKGYSLEIIYLKNYLSSRRSIRRIKGRIIGENGKTKKLMERLTGCSISIYGNTVSIIGKQKNLSVTKRGLAMLIEGAKHGSVYSFLERNRKSLKF